MKVGILTWFMGANYGAKAQSYSLQKVITEMGHECYMIDYRPNGYVNLNVRMNTNIPNKIVHPCLLLNGIRRSINFDISNRIYNFSKRCKSADDINSLELDAVVFGSDAIFNIKHLLFEDIYYGVGISGTKKIAYAPSCEFLEPDYKLPAACIASLKSFDSISVRDSNTADLIEFNLGVRPDITSDPTILYDFDEFQYDIKYKDYILLYTFSDWSCYSKQLIEYAKAKNIKIISVGRYYNWADYSYTAASLDCWITAFRYASIVFTDSFHGSVFAVKNQKELIVCSREDKKAKIISFLQDVGISRGFFDGKQKISEYVKEAIDYSVVTENVNRLKDYSICFLEKALRHMVK